MSNLKLSTRILLAGAGLASIGMLGASPAMAKPGRVEAHGTCSAGSTWTIKSGPNNGKLETEFEVDSNVVGQTWSVKITDNGARIFRGTAMTTAPSGSFTVRVNAADQAGTDALRGTARNAATGEACIAPLSV